MKRALFIATWVVAALVATSMALAAVGSVTDNVTDSPGATLASPNSSTSVDDSTTTSTSEEPTTTTTTRSSTTSTTLPDDDGDDEPGTSTTSTTIPHDEGDDDTPPTSVVPIVTETRTYQLEGGWVKVDIGPGLVELLAASPAPGFSMKAEDEDEGDRVKVTFESEDHKSELEIRWNDGKLIVDIEEHADDDHGGDSSGGG